MITPKADTKNIEISLCRNNIDYENSRFLVIKVCLYYFPSGPNVKVHLRNSRDYINSSNYSHN